MATSERRTPIEESEDMDIIDETIGLAAVDYDLRIRHQELEAREFELRTREQALENAEEFAAAMRRARLETVEEQSDTSFHGFRPRNEDQQLQSTRVEDDSRTTPTRNMQDMQRGRSRERNGQNDDSVQPRSPSYETVHDRPDESVRPRRLFNPIDSNPRVPSNPTDQNPRVPPNPTDPTPRNPFPPNLNPRNPFPYPYHPYPYPPPNPHVPYPPQPAYNPYYPSGTGNSLQCEVVNKRPTIVKWYGKIGEELGQDLETFIKSVDEHLENVKFRNPKDALDEARSYLDRSKGDWQHYATSVEYEKISTWGELKGFLRYIYSSVSAHDPVVALQKILRQATNQRQENERDCVSF